MPEPMLLPMFANQGRLTRIPPDRNARRFYRIALWRNVFARALVVRQRLRIGGRGCVGLDPHPDEGTAINTLATMLRKRHRRGHRLRAIGVLITAWLAWGGPVRAADCAANATQTELTECAGKEASQADAALNAVYHALLGKIDAASQARLRTAQRAWISFRDAECTFQTGGGVNQDGTIWPMLVNQCLARLTRARAAALQAQLKCQSWDLACPGG